MLFDPLLAVVVLLDGSKLPPDWQATATRQVRVEPGSAIASLIAPAPFRALRPDATEGPLLFAVGRDCRWRKSPDGAIELETAPGAKFPFPPGSELPVLTWYPGESKPIKIVMRRADLEDGRPGCAAAEVVTVHLWRDDFTFVDTDSNGCFDDFGVDLVLVGDPDTLAKQTVDELRAKAKTFEGFLKSGKRRYLVGLRPATRFVAGPVVGETVDDGYLRHMGQLNHLRRQGGLAPLGMDESLTAACEAHARYCAKNGLCHEEDPTKPGFTAEGDKEGRSSVVGTGGSAVDGILGMFQTLFHRTPFLQPEPYLLGVGFADNNYVCDWRTHERQSLHDPQPYPFDRQTGVEPRGSDEFPDAKPADLATTEGMLIALHFDPAVKVDLLDAKIRDLMRDQDVEFASTSPAKPAPGGRSMFPTNEGAICLFPRRVLDADTLYEVKIRWKQGGKKSETTWRFWTKSGPR